MSNKQRKFEKSAERNPLSISAEFSINAAASGEGDAPAIPTFQIEAYSGASIRQAWSRVPMVVDLAGMQAGDTLPILYAHDSDPYNGNPLDGVMGQSTKATNNGRNLSLAGQMIGEGQTFDRVMRLAAKGMKFQASIGADIQRSEFVEAGQKVTVNGREFAGPISVVRASSLREVSIVLMGADPNTSAAIAAEATEDDLMADNATSPTDKVEAAADGAAGKPITESLPITAKGTDGDALIERAENLEKAVNAEREEVKKLAARLELAEKRLSRGPAIHTGGDEVDGVKVVEAALCKQAGLPHLEKSFDGRTLEAADKVVRDVSISQVLLKAAKANGYSGSDRITQSNVMPMLQASFATHDIQNLLAALVNKFLLSGFMAVERSWQEISAIRSVADFKAINLMRLNGSLKFQKVGNAGELKIAAVNDYKRSVNADTWGITTQLTRQDIINDDLNALSMVPQRMGRGAALAMNDTVWAAFLDSNSSYYQSVTAAAGNALSYAGLETAVTAYRRLNDPDGNPLSIAPRILLVPPELEPKAVQLMTQSALIVTALGSTSSKAVEPSANPFVGRYKIVTSNYLPAAGTVANSTWWLLADPADLSALDVVFLNGQQVPTIEQVMIDYQLLGVGLRGYMDFGVIKAEPLSCLRMATA